MGGPGSPILDSFGDAVNCWSHIPGDSWCTKHDTCKKSIMDVATWARVPCEAKVFGLFSDLIPVEAVGEGGGLEDARGRQGKVPDFRFRLPLPTNGQSPAGAETDTLAELKVSNAGNS